MQAESEDSPKVTMKFKASMLGNEPIIKPACPKSDAWFQSMGKMHIKPSDLHYVGKMGIEVAIVQGEIKEVSKKIGEQNISKTGVLSKTFDIRKF